MPVLPQEIRDAIGDFIALIQDDAMSPEDRVLRLRRSLDRLALLQHDVSHTFDERDYPHAPVKDHNTLRSLVEKRFPSLGYYNIPGSVTQHIAEADMHVADAIDDITDIASELYEVQWCWQHTSVDDALWHFTQMYSGHWEEHLRGLQLCLQRLAAGHEATDAV